MKKNWLLAGTIMIVSLASFGQSQGNTVPEFRSDEEKVKWVNEHPEEYKRLNGEEVKTAELPEEFKTDAEKSAYMREKGLGHEITILEDVPGFPKYIDTGNPEMDKADYSYRKDLWVEQNRAIYDQMIQTPEENLTKEQRMQKGEIIIRN
jgi:hypothetical protein